MIDRVRFKELCARGAQLSVPKRGIGTYSEKRLHRILKSLIADESFQEVPIGDYVADVLKDGIITEVQTGGFQKYLPKLRYYLDKTEFRIRLIIPIIAEKTIIRIDEDTGEIIRKKRSPLKGNGFDGLAALYPIRQILPSDRVETELLFIAAEEHRYSERIRYRKAGAYISELFPTELMGQIRLKEEKDFLDFIPKQTEFTAKEYSDFSKKKGRELYSCLNTLCAMGLLTKRKDGKAYVFSKTEKC